jgi:hypothetical protein
VRAGRDDFEYEDRSWRRNRFFRVRVVQNAKWMELVEIPIALAALVFVLALSEAVRTIVAHLVKVRPARRFGVLQLPGRSGSKKSLLLVILVGPLGAYLAPSVLAFALYRYHGVPTGVSVVGEVGPGYDAVGKLVAGDRIIGVDGEVLDVDGPLLSRRVNAKAGAPMTLDVERAGQRQSVTIQPRSTEGVWRLGIVFRRERTNELGLTAPLALTYPYAQVKSAVERLVVARDAADPGGPVRIVSELSGAPEPFSLRATRLAALLATYGLLVILVLDLVRLVLLVLRRRTS